MNVLEARHLTKVYGTGANACTALDDVTLEVREGEFLAVVGASGSGKSTLLHALGGVDRPTSGEVLLNGASVYDRSDEELAIFRRREVGLIYQFYNLVPVLTVVENLTLPVALDGREINQERLGSLLDRLGLRGLEDRLPSQPSGGQQQRCAIGRALMNAPAVVLADEPTGNLDSENSREVLELLHASNRELGQTLVMITHDEEAALTADRVVSLQDGHILTLGGR
ncbi:ABC transporter ATP-binding protein [Olsenella sp. YH-ols2217]|uniref:ABC transporter ATP-binding protein n=1 Tax=Kribbibacterium absianum TaxID=3044210 RepID=A0ABT6ZHZ3_9ACTN|nr:MULTISPECIES: ABC transporter ATP-binding protein [unclassified Olsenella]MDJ1121180.1 ABC transporter ATP-binding protein [Olsenella sp. YH-ols2216]MDJ1128671.1 ABC transporter ATP-binding protein [Olsenella sp. YH-ols2217]